jgi:hypothetical protein
VSAVEAGHWVAATLLLGKPAPISQPYPHVCGSLLPSGGTVWRRDCGACQREALTAVSEVSETTAGLPEVSEEQRQLEARKMGERE